MVRFVFFFAISQRSVCEPYLSLIVNYDEKLHFQHFFFSFISSLTYNLTYNFAHVNFDGSSSDLPFGAVDS